ncbi:Uncharacterised protein [Streptococcus pneumoniae]|nr:Uncharacterised protein [Streptococcus pneumoniae]
MQKELSKLVNYSEVQYQEDVETIRKEAYFLTVQGVKVMKTIKKDDNAVVGLGKLFIADKLMDTARWLIKPEDKK